MDNTPNKEALIRSYLLELMKTTPIEKIKVTSFVDKIGISRATFYQYYDSIYDVLQQIEDMYFEAVSKWWLSDDPGVADPNNYRSRIRFGLEEMRAHRDVITVLTGPYGDKLFESKLKKRISICAERYLGKATNGRDELHSAFFRSGLWKTILEWLRQDDDTAVSAEEMTDIVLKYFRLYYTEN